MSAELNVLVGILVGHHFSVIINVGRPKLGFVALSSTDTGCKKYNLVFFGNGCSKPLTNKVYAFQFDIYMFFENLKELFFSRE